MEPSLIIWMSLIHIIGMIVSFFFLISSNPWDRNQPSGPEAMAMVILWEIFFFIFLIKGLILGVFKAIFNEQS